MKLQLVATCLFGLEHLLGEEIDALGYERISTIDGRVTFLGDEQAVALSNVFLRYAERVLIKVGSFEARSFTELFDGTYALPWEDFIGKLDAFPVKGHSIKSDLHSIPDCQAIIKKAVVKKLSSIYGISIFPEERVKYQIEFFILNNEATLMIDTSGMPLHKRGYRRESNDAPIRETLAPLSVIALSPRNEISPLKVYAPEEIVKASSVVTEQKRTSATELSSNIFSITIESLSPSKYTEGSDSELLCTAYPVDV